MCCFDIGGTVFLRYACAVCLEVDIKRSEKKNEIHICLKTDTVFLINTMKAQQAQ